MKIRRLGPFRKDFGKFPGSIKRRAERALRLLVQNLHHPSLEARIVDKRKRIWKARMNGGYRFTYRIEGEIIELRRIGTHSEMERPGRW
jgi:mRNA-degrading endonuclease RelE of RelBE toxin-antitoxin system